MSTNERQGNHEAPTERSTIELLDRLGAAERSAPDAGFEARIARGSLARSEAPLALPAASGMRAWWAGTPVRVAAALALLAGAWFAWHRASTPGALPGTVAIHGANGSRVDSFTDEEWFEEYTLVTAALDDGAGDAIDELVSDTAELGSRINTSGSIESIMRDTGDTL